MSGFCRTIFSGKFYLRHYLAAVMDYLNSKKKEADRFLREKNVYQFLDFWNMVGILLLLVLFLIVFTSIVYFNQSILTGALVVVTGVYVFTTFNQMREARKQTLFRPVQSEVGYSAEHDAKVPGIRNFGSETAFHIELLASLEPDEDDKTTITRRISKWESPTTLGPDEFEPVIQDTENFKDNLNDLEGGQLSLYYAYSTASVPRVPSNEEELLDKDLIELQKEYPEPTSFDVKTLQEQYFPEKQVTHDAPTPSG